MTRIILYSIFFLGVGFVSGKSYESKKRNDNFVDLYTTTRACMTNLRAATGSLAEVLEQTRETEKVWRGLRCVKSFKRKEI